MRPLFLEHALKINPLRELNSALAKAERPVASIIHIGAVESGENLAKFRFDKAEGAGKPCHMVQRSLRFYVRLNWWSMMKGAMARTFLKRLERLCKRLRSILVSRHRPANAEKRMT